MHRDFSASPKWMASEYIGPLISDDDDCRLGPPHQSATLVRRILNFVVYWLRIAAFFGSCTPNPRPKDDTLFDLTSPNKVDMACNNKYTQTQNQLPKV